LSRHGQARRQSGSLLLRAAALEATAAAACGVAFSSEQQLLSHEEGKAMAVHKFKAGQQVIVAPHRPSGVTGGTFKIVRLLPEERGVWQYRVKSVADGHERVVLESDLTH